RRTRHSQAPRGPTCGRLNENFSRTPFHRQWSRRRMPDVRAQPTGTRQSILESLKRDGPLAIAQLAERLGMSGEAVRQQLVQLQREGWIEALHEREPARHSGRPPTRYRLTQTGDHVFPKHYDALTVAVIDAVASELGPAALERILSALTEARARQWEPRLAG